MYRWTHVKGKEKENVEENKEERNALLSIMCV